MLHVRSGDAAGANRVSSATVRLDGTTLLGPSAFNQQQSEWSLPVALGSTAVLSVSLASKPGSYLEIWLQGKRSGTLFCEDGSPTAIGDLQQAIAATPAGGTVLVCPGTHRVAEVRIAKPLTIEGIGATKPVLDFGGQCCGLRVDGAVGGTIRIRGLQFQNGKYQEILLSGSTDSVVIEKSEFYPGSDLPDAPWGLYAGIAVGPALSVLIQDNAFHGGDVGVHVHGSNGISILNNTFSSENFALHLGDNSGLRIADNTISGCGPNYCIGIFDNLAPAAGSLTELLRNSIHVNFSRATREAVYLGTATARVEGNEIVAAGGSTDPADPSTWPIWVSAIHVGGKVTLLGNRISGAWIGLVFQGSAVSATGSDNTISRVGSVLALGDAAAVTLNGNDFTGYSSPISIWYSTNTMGPVSLRCNWWGSTDGPQNVNWVAGQWPTMYTPWATQPIANQPAVACTP
ncbi:MAG TPA: right-handed parallel beta-helix repeat-containing protein [Gemmatimonadaceae bacterium]